MTRKEGTATLKDGQEDGQTFKVAQDDDQEARQMCGTDGEGAMGRRPTTGLEASLPEEPGKQEAEETQPQETPAAQEKVLARTPTGNLELDSIRPPIGTKEQPGSGTGRSLAGWQLANSEAGSRLAGQMLTD